MTYLDIVNEVLLRLREQTVASVGQSTYSRLIGLYVNDAKRQVEDAFNWSALDVESVVTTVAGTSGYTVVGSGVRQKNVSANVTTSGRQCRMRNVSAKWIQDQQQLTTVQNGTPNYFAWAGKTTAGDSTVEVFPTPDGTYSLSFNMTVPQANLTSDGDILTVPYEPVVAGAVARAMVERGEDGGLNSSEAYGLFKGILADHISLEFARDESCDSWSAV